MTVLHLAEHGPPTSLALDDVACRALVRSRLVDAAPDPDTPGRWLVRASGKVGVAAVQLPDGAAITVRIRPKVPIARLLFLLGYSRNAKGWRSEHIQVAPEPELLPAFARLYALEAEKALRQGLLKGYRSTDETALVVRGRIRLGAQLHRHHGQLIPLELSHDEYTEDIAENRLLRAACHTLLRLPGGLPGDVRTMLLRLRVLLADITPITRGDKLPVWRLSRLNARYHAALRLADLVLRGASVEHRPGDVTVHGFLFEMAKVFEDFVTTALREALAERDGHSVLQDRDNYLDERKAIRMIPDFVRYDADGTPVAVADAKYKAEKPEGFPDADLYQMLAYCTALNLPDGHLVYAKGNAEHGSHRVRHAGITIHQHAVDLELPPAELLDQIRAIADQLTSTRE